MHRAQRLHELPLAGARRAQDPQPQVDGDLHGRGPHPAARTGDQQRRPGRQGQLQHAVVGGGGGDRQRRSVGPGHLLRLVGRDRRRKQGVLRIAAGHRVAEHRVSDGEALDVLAERLHHARCLAAEHGGKLREGRARRPVPLAALPVDRVHSGRPHRDQQLAAAGHRPAHLGEPLDGGAAVTGVRVGLGHDAPSSSGGPGLCPAASLRSIVAARC